MKKKPKQHFVEFKNLCDVLTGVMIALEIQEGSAPMRSKLFCDQYQSHIALSLRLLQTAGLLNTWRVLIADAAFGSVSACKALVRWDRRAPAPSALRACRTGLLQNITNY